MSRSGVRPVGAARSWDAHPFKRQKLREAHPKGKSRVLFDADFAIKLGAQCK